MAAEAVLKFLDDHNRPYSVQDIQNGMKGSDFTKSSILKALESLVEKRQVIEKTYGKQKVYFIAQDVNTSSKEVAEQILAFDRQINDLNLTIRENSETLKGKMATYDKIKGKMSLPEACAKKVELEEELKKLKSALKEFDGVNLVTTEVKKTVQKNYDTYLGIYRKRKRICLDILDAILENYPKTKKQLLEDIGMETDEDAGFSIDK